MSTFLPWQINLNTLSIEEQFKQKYNEYVI